VKVGSKRARNEPCRPRSTASLGRVPGRDRPKWSVAKSRQRSRWICQSDISRREH